MANLAEQIQAAAAASTALAISNIEGTRKMTEAADKWSATVEEWRRFLERHNENTQSFHDKAMEILQELKKALDIDTRKWNRIERVKVPLLIGLAAALVALTGSIITHWGFWRVPPGAPPPPATTLQK